MKCVICGKEIEKSRYSNAILCSSECYKKHFWLEYVERDKVDPNCLVINGCHYVIGDENTLSSFRGYGGSKFQIKKFGSDEIITTTNLWYQGEIPKDMLELFPDNAEFV